MMYRSIVAVLVMVVMVLGCTSDQGRDTGLAGGNGTPISTAEHRQMVDYLDSMRRRARPAENYHLNTAMASKIKEGITSETDMSKRLTKMVNYARQLAMAGDTDSAVGVYEDIVQQMGGLDTALSPQTKPLYELLAIAYLRKGELENCVANHNDDSCILPLTDKAVHQLRSGSEKALELYDMILKKYPADKNTQYLKMVAEMTLGLQNNLSRLSPSSSLPEWSNKATSLRVDKGGVAGGTVVDDFNNDGYLDIIASSYRYEDELTYYENTGTGSFTDKTSASNLIGITGGLNINHTDYNNDGNLDIFVMRGGWLGAGGIQPNSLLQGHGDGTFTDVTRSAGLFSLHPTQTSVWADFNLDGFVDLFVGNEAGAIDYGGTGAATGEATAHRCELYINNGDGTFTDRAAAVGLDLQLFVKGVTAGDINNDGYPDIYLSLVNAPNVLIVNSTGQAGKLQFSMASDRVQVGDPVLSFPTWMWDFNNDGLEDIYVAAYDVRKLRQVPADFMNDIAGARTDIMPPALYQNNGDGTFTNVAVAMNLQRSMFAMGCNFGDLNADGDLDFYIGTGAPALTSIVPNRMFLNKGTSFEEVSYNGFAHIQKGHGVGWGDFDADGDEDIYAVMGGAFEGDIAQNVLFENPLTGSNTVTVALIGTRSNRAAIGARVRIVATDGRTEKVIYRTVGGGSSFGANSLQLEIGLGMYSEVKDVAVLWPVAKSQWASYGAIPIGGIVEITEGAEEPIKSIDLPTISLKASEGNGAHNHHHH